MNPANASMTGNIALSAEKQSALDSLFKDLNIDPASFYPNKPDVLGQFPPRTNSVSSDVDFFGQFYDSNIKGPTYGAAHSHGMSVVSSTPTFSHNQQQLTTYLPHSSRTIPFGTVLSELTQPGLIHESPQTTRIDQHSSWGLTSTLSPLAENENTFQEEESSPGSFFCHYDPATSLYFDVPVPLTAESRSSSSASQAAHVNHCSTQGFTGQFPVSNENALHGNEIGSAGLTFYHYDPDTESFDDFPESLSAESSSKYVSSMMPIAPEAQ
ncbi:c2h2 finger domain protein [Moniliophthora roreri]|nr:c2h2 finger domain protein [Moniliophthora roreri]